MVSLAWKLTHEDSFIKVQIIQIYKFYQAGDEQIPSTRRSRYPSKLFPRPPSQAYLMESLALCKATDDEFFALRKPWLSTQNKTTQEFILFPTPF